ncbi:MAG: hypothetical protein ABIJ37_02505 [Pseudomonadota bacterium]
MKNDNDLKTLTHICMPELSVVGLLIVSWSFKNSNTFFYYDIFPRYLRGIVKIFGISPKSIEAVLSWFAGITLIQVKQGDDVAGYSDFHIGAQEWVSVISEELIPLIENDHWFSILEKLLGKEPALSYAVKQIADCKIFKQLVASISCCASIGYSARCVAVWDCRWPEEWLDVIKRNALHARFDFFKWPNWCRTARNVFFVLSLIPKIIRVGLGIFKRGISWKINDKKHYKIITEFIDPRRLNNTCYDPDCWVDGKSIHKEDIFFFITNEQKRILEGIGYKITKTLSDVRHKGYEIQLLDTLSYPPVILQEYILHAFKIMGKAFTTNNTVVADVMIKALKEYLNFYPLFYRYSADNFIYLTFPNGHSSLRHNSGIITGLCRKNGIRSVGCQTRAVHSKNYEYVFDSFDLHFAWGRVWYGMMGTTTRFIRQCTITGCIYLDYLMQEDRKMQNASGSDRIQVCIFPGDISPRHHYSLGYALSFIINCARLAVDNPDIDFVIKNKEPEYTDIMLASEAFMEIYRQTKGNLRFEDRLRHEYIDLLCTSDIIIAIGFTTPGFEALMFKKRVIYYNELKYGGQAYSEIPDLIAGNYDELAVLFKNAVNDYEIYAENIAGVLKGLDPFRDGRALERINCILTGNV